MNGNTNVGIMWGEGSQESQCAMYDFSEKRKRSNIGNFSHLLLKVVDTEAYKP